MRACGGGPHCQPFDISKFFIEIGETKSQGARDAKNNYIKVEQHKLKVDFVNCATGAGRLPSLRGFCPGSAHDD